MKSQVKFSIITVCYNSEDTISRTIESLLNQSYENYEYIIVDGKSTDRTLNIVNKYLPKFNQKIKVISEPDKGIYDAMNKGIEFASGDVVGILNSDDYYLNNTLELVEKTISNHSNKSNLIISGEIFLVQKNQNLLLTTSEERFLSKVKSFETPIRHPATFVTKDVYENVGLFDTNIIISADCDFILRSYYSGIEFLFINSPLTYMSDFGISHSLKGNLLKIKDQWIILNKHSSGTKKYKNILFYTIKMLIKNFVPQRLLNGYRKKYN